MPSDKYLDETADYHEILRALDDPLTPERVIGKYTFRVGITDPSDMTYCLNEDGSVYALDSGCRYPPRVYKYANLKQAADDLLNNSWFDKLNAKDMLKRWGMYVENE